MATTEPCVHIVDDEASVRDALAFLFGSHGLATRSYDGGPALMQALECAALRGCIVLDVRMEPHSGLQVHDALVERGVRVPVIFLSGHGDIPMAVDALKKGAFDFVEKPFSGDALVERVQRALRVEAAQQASAARGDEREARMASLSERERDVMRLVVAGLPNKLVADQLDISVRTVEVHRARVFDKMAVKSAVELANLLRRLELP